MGSIEARLHTAQCAGCGVCAYVCKEGAITLKADEYGFEYPSVDESACVTCGACILQCPAMSDTVLNEAGKCFAAKAKSETVLKESSSGGLATLLARKFIQEGGVVYGATLDENYNCRHIRVGTIDDCNLIKGSKYVQSDIRGVIGAIETDLALNVRVLFIGLPCQVDAVRNAMHVSVRGLYCVDIVCHGAPSLNFFQEHLHYLEAKYKSIIRSYKFRDKKYGWNLIGSFEVDGSGGQTRCHKLIAEDDLYYYSFLKGFSYRESCFSCKYAKPDRVGDVTLGDYWGIRDIHPDIDPRLGVSLVLVNTHKGEELLSGLKGAVFTESSFEKAVACNPNLRYPSLRPESRDVFLRELETADYATMQKRFFRSISRYKFKYSRRLKKSGAVVLRKLFPGLVRHIRGL